VQRVVLRERLYAEAEALARRVLSQPEGAVRLAKRAVVEGIEMPLAQGLALETLLAAQAAVSR
jgi:enoyl-CoA hydratase/carnithine racemase